MEHKSEDQKAPVGIDQASPAADKTSREIGLKKVVLITVLAVFLTALLTAGALTGAFLLGNSINDEGFEQKRQTVVQEGEVIADISQDVGRSVVSILTEQESTIESLYFGPRTRTSQAAGTGVIIDTNGLILTNKHVVPEGTNTVQIITSEGEVYDNVEIIGRDPLNDLAVLKVKDPKNFIAAKLADSDTVRTGQKVIAIGNALGQFQNTVTSGIISGQGRPIEASDESGSANETLSNLFQTDAAINSGNSGGPLLNFNGEVIAINTAVAADAENIGFAIPINEAKGIVESVKSTGKVSRAYLGVRYVMITAELKNQLKLSVSDGAYVSTEPGSVVNGSPADKAGLRGGDVITKVGSVALGDKTPLASAVGRLKVGEIVELTIIRDGKEQKVKVTLAAAPGN